MEQLATATTVTATSLVARACAEAELQDGLGGGRVLVLFGGRAFLLVLLPPEEMTRQIRIKKSKRMQRRATTKITKRMPRAHDPGLFHRIPRGSTSAWPAARPCTSACEITSSFDRCPRAGTAAANSRNMSNAVKPPLLDRMK
jgi:hypothetical protein